EIARNGARCAVGDWRGADFGGGRYCQFLLSEPIERAGENGTVFPARLEFFERVSERGEYGRRNFSGHFRDFDDDGFDERGGDAFWRDGGDLSAGIRAARTVCAGGANRDQQFGGSAVDCVRDFRAGFFRVFRGRNDRQIVFSAGAGESYADIRDGRDFVGVAD